MKTGHLVLYSNGYNVDDPGHRDHHVWMAALVTCTHHDWEPPTPGKDPEVPQPAEGTVHLTVFVPNNPTFTRTSVGPYEAGMTGECWKPVS